MCSGHFHGGEKKEGDVPVADPQVDPPLIVELPPPTPKRTERRNSGSNNKRQKTDHKGDHKPEIHKVERFTKLKQPSLANLKNGQTIANGIIKSVIGTTSPTTSKCYMYLSKLCSWTQSVIMWTVTKEQVVKEKESV